MNIRGIGAVTLLSAVLGIGAGSASAGVAYSQNFDSGSATFTTNDPYWLDQALANGYIIKSTTAVSAFSFGAAIPVDVSGSGYFLFDGTASYPGNGTIPPGQDQFFISPTFSVKANTSYAVSFYLTDANNINNPQVQPELDGTLLGSPVSPVGTYGSNGWQQFTFTWNSGSNTSASLILHDFVQTPDGNDFGVDNILVQSTPEPAALPLMLGLTGFSVFAVRRRRRQ